MAKLVNPDSAAAEMRAGSAQPAGQAQGALRCCLAAAGEWAG